MLGRCCQRWTRPCEQVRADPSEWVTLHADCHRAAIHPDTAVRPACSSIAHDAMHSAILSWSDNCTSAAAACRSLVSQLPIAASAFVQPIAGNRINCTFCYWNLADALWKTRCESQKLSATPPGVSFCQFASSIPPCKGLVASVESIPCEI